MTSHQSATFLCHPSNPNNFLVVRFTTKSPAQPLFLPHSLLILHVCGHTACLPVSLHQLDGKKDYARLSTDSAPSRRSPLSKPMLETSVRCEWHRQAILASELLCVHSFILPSMPNHDVFVYLHNQHSVCVTFTSRNTNMKSVSRVLPKGSQEASDYKCDCKAISFVFEQTKLA